MIGRYLQHVVENLPRVVDWALRPHGPSILPQPTDRHGVLRSIGTATNLAKFCPHFSSVTSPFRTLMLKDSEFCWRPEVHGVALDILKLLLVNAPVLAYFDSSKPLTVQSDASSGGLGAILLQKQSSSGICVAGYDAH